MMVNILILAKSNKRRHDGSYGACVAGVQLSGRTPGQWIRLVADRAGDALSLDQCNGFDVLDIVRTNITPAPLANQIENCTFDHISFVETISKNELKEIFFKMKHSFFGKAESYFDGVPLNSLGVMIFKNIYIYWEEHNGRYYQKADFDFGKNSVHGVAMTDPKHYTNKASLATKTIPLGICVISLPSSPSYESLYPKFIASIIEIDSYDRNLYT